MARASSSSGLALAAALSVVLATPVAHAEAPHLAAVLVAGHEVATSRAETLARSVRAAVGAQPGLELISAEDEAFLFRSPKPRARSKKELAAARKHLDDASTAFTALDFATAVKHVNKAGAVLQPMIGLRVAVELDKERVQLAVALAHAQRDEERLDQLLREFSIRFPSDASLPGLWPPDIVNRLKTLVRPATSVLNVRTRPSGTVFVDGREIGASPVRLGALPAGAHRVEIEAPGHFTFEQWVDTVDGQEAMLEVQLAPNLSVRLEKLGSGEALSPELEAAIRAAAPNVKVLIFAWVNDEEVALKRVDLAPGLPEGMTWLSRASNQERGLALAASHLFREAGSRGGGGVPLWAWISGGAGVAAIGAGVTLRVLSESTENRFNERLGALTQREAYELRDRANWQSRGGGLLMGLGLAAIGSVVGILLFEPSGS